MDSTIIDAIQESAVKVVDAGDKHKHAFFVNEKTRVVDLEKYSPVRRFFRGELDAHTLEDFCRYVNDHNTSAPVFVNVVRMGASCVLDLGSAETPGGCHHAARLTLPMTADYKELRNINGDSMGQKSAAEFLEDYRHLITAYSAAGDEIPAAKYIDAIRKYSVEAQRSRETNVQNYSESMTEMERIEAKNADYLPARFVWECVPYLGFASRSFSLRMSINNGNQATFKFKIIGLDSHMEFLGQEFADLIKARCEDREVYLGTFES